MIKPQSTSRLNFLIQFAITGAVRTSRIITLASLIFPVANLALAVNLTETRNQTEAMLDFLPKISSLGKQDNGDALRDQAFKLSLDQILTNQESILESIVEINNSIEDLRVFLGEKFSESDLNKSYKEVKGFFDVGQGISETLARDPDKFNSKSVYAEFQKRSTEFIAIASRFNSTIGSIDAGNVALLLIAARIANTLSRAQQNFGLLELKFSEDLSRDAILTPDVAMKKALQHAQSALKHMMEVHLKKEKSALEEEIQAQRNVIDTSIFKSFLDGLLQKPETIQSGYACFRAFPKGPHVTIPFGTPEEGDAWEAIFDNGPMTREVGKVSMSLEMKSLSPSGQADLVLKMEKTRWEKVKEWLHRKDGIVTDKSVQPDKKGPVISSNEFIPDDTDSCVGFVKEPLTENYIDAQLEDIKIPLAKHARAKVYQAALKELEPALQKLLTHNKDMKTAFINDRK